jgi:hypothetical protein
MRDYRGEISAGMAVRGLDGARLGRVARLSGDVFVLTKGVLFPREYLVRYQDIAAVRDGAVIVGSERVVLTGEGVDYPDRTAGSAPTRRPPRDEVVAAVEKGPAEPPRERPAPKPARPRADPGAVTEPNLREGLLDEEELRREHDPRRDPDAIVDGEVPAP